MNAKSFIVNFADPLSSIWDLKNINLSTPPSTTLETEIVTSEAFPSN